MSHHFKKSEGTRAEVFHGTAKHTSGGLHKSDLMKNKTGRIVSKKKHNSAKKEMRLVKHGFGTKKGKFGFVKLRKYKSRKNHRGGSGLSPLNPADVDYQMSMPHMQDGGAPYGSSLHPSELVEAPTVSEPVPMEGGKSRSQQRQRQQQKQRQRQQQKQRQRQQQRQQQVAGDSTPADVNASYMLGK